MKNKTSRKSKDGKMSISQLVFALIVSRRLDKRDGDERGKTALAVVTEIRKKFPGTKFNLAHYAWYLSRFRKQKKDGLKVDRLHEKGVKPPKKGKGRKKK